MCLLVEKIHTLWKVKHHVVRMIQPVHKTKSYAIFAAAISFFESGSNTFLGLVDGWKSKGNALIFHIKSGSFRLCSGRAWLTNRSQRMRAIIQAMSYELFLHIFHSSYVKMSTKSSFGSTESVHSSILGAVVVFWQIPMGLMGWF